MSHYENAVKLPAMLHREETGGHWIELYLSGSESVAPLLKPGSIGPR